MSKTHWNTIVDTTYLSGEEILGSKPILTIRDFKREEVTGDGGRKENCGVLYWAENAKPMIVNITNVKQITKLFKSPYKEDWQGKQIQLTTEKVKAFGKLWDAIRICKTLPQQQAPQPESIPPCGDCGAEIKGVGDYTPDQVAATTYKRYGLPLCSDCSNKRKEADKPKESEEENNESK